jgi:hypothetical protein
VVTILFFGLPSPTEMLRDGKSTSHARPVLSVQDEIQVVAHRLELCSCAKAEPVR